MFLAHWLHKAHHSIALEKGFLNEVSKVDLVARVGGPLCPHGTCRFLSISLTRLALHATVQLRDAWLHCQCHAVAIQHWHLQAINHYQALNYKL